MIKSGFDEAFNRLLKHYNLNEDHSTNVQRREDWYQGLRREWTLPEVIAAMKAHLDQDFAPGTPKESRRFPQFGTIHQRLKEARSASGAPCGERLPDCPLCENRGIVSLHRTDGHRWATNDAYLEFPKADIRAASHAFACYCGYGRTWQNGITYEGTVIPALTMYTDNLLDPRYTDYDGHHDA